MRHTRRIDARYPQRGKDGQWLLTTGWWLEERAAEAWARVRNECLRRFGSHLLLTSAGRTYAQQVALRKAKGRIAARPGSSWHEAGLAIDVDMGHLNALTGSQAASEAFLAEFGWRRSCWEAWHYEYHTDYPRSRGVAGAIAYIGNR